MSVSERLVQIGLLGEAVDGAGVAVLVADETGAYVAANSYACEMLGYSRDELVTLRVQDVIVDDDVDAHYARFVHEQHERGTISLRRKDGSTFGFRFVAGETKISALTYYVSFGLPED
ncbi:MAG: PAS domain S-box protein [Gaiellaceae bacterium]